MSQQSFFSKIDLLKLQEVIDFLIHNQSEIVLKIQLLHYKTKIINKSGKIISVLKFSPNNFINEEAICSFEIKEEKYFFKTFIKSGTSDCKIDIPEEIFQLQRRNDFRVNVPTSLEYKCEIKTVNFVRQNIKVEVRDMSLGGMMVCFPTKQLEINKNDEVVINLKMLQFEEEKIILLAKHIKKIPSTNMTLVGLQYTDPQASFLTDLQSLLVALDRLHRGKGYE